MSLSCGESDSDTDSLEEVQIKQFFIKDVEQEIKQIKAQRASVSGIKRHPGYYKLQNPKDESFQHKTYQGKRWDVNSDNQLERSTRRLTINAVNKALWKEQERQIKEEADLLLKARRILSPVQQELLDLVQCSEKLMQVEETSTKNQQMKLKDEVLNQLLKLKNLEIIAKETEEERQRQLRLLQAMVSKANRTPSNEDLVESMATTHQRKSSIHTDIQQAFATYLDQEQRLDEDYQEAMSEMLDESLIKMTLKHDRDLTRKLFEDEQSKQIREEQNSSTAERKETKENLKVVLGDLKEMFNNVQREEDEKDEEYQKKVMEFKTRVQEEMLKRFASKWTEKACAIEKSRRIRESEHDMLNNDPLTEKVKTQMSHTQRQMILEKFHGKYQNVPGSLDEAECYQGPRDDESEHDKKLRQLRMLSRRPSGVIRDSDED